jgi:hypothetical protein
MDSGHGQARLGDNPGQLALVLRRMKTPVEGRPPNALLQTPLQQTRLLDDHVAIVLIARQEIGVRDEAGAIFVDQHLTSELDRLGGLASFVQLGVQLEDAEEFLAVGHLFALQHPAAGRAADVQGPFLKGFQFGVQREDFRAGASFNVFSQLSGPVDDRFGQADQFPVRTLQSSLVAGSLAGGDAVDLSGQPFDLLVEVLVLSPTAGADDCR